MSEIDAMTSTNGGSEILKTDGLGRVRVPRERQEKLLDEFERSGLSGAKFAALCGVKYPSFAGWIARRKRARAGDGSRAGEGAVRWLEAVVGGGSGDGAALVMHLPGGAHLEISGRRQAMLAAEVLRALSLAPGS